MSTVKKIKIFYWANVGSNLNVLRNDYFTKQDVGSRYIGFFTDKSYDGMTIEVDVAGAVDKTIQTFTSTITSGYAEMSLELTNTTDTEFSFISRIKDGVVVAVSPIGKFSMIDSSLV